MFDIKAFFAAVFFVNLNNRFSFNFYREQPYLNSYQYSNYYQQTSQQFAASSSYEASNYTIDKLHLTESHLQNLRQVVQKLQPQSLLPNQSEIKSVPPPPLSPPPLPPQPPPPPLPPSTEKPAAETKTPGNAKKISPTQQQARKGSEQKMLPNWRCERNKEGRVYYYNTKTKLSQWHFPKAEHSSATSLPTAGTASGAALRSLSSKQLTQKNEAEDKTKVMSTLGSEAFDDEVSLAVSTTSSVDAKDPAANSITSDASTSETFRFLKEQFRDMLSKLVVRILQPYLKECKLGHVANVEDFKYLARKFTHTILDKEMSRSTRLDFVPSVAEDKRVRVKAEEFIKRYMSKFGAEYSRKADEANNPSTS